MGWRWPNWPSSASKYRPCRPCPGCPHARTQDRRPSRRRSDPRSGQVPPGRHCRKASWLDCRSGKTLRRRAHRARCGKSSIKNGYSGATNSPLAGRWLIRNDSGSKRPSREVRVRTGQNEIDRFRGQCARGDIVDRWCTIGSFCLDRDQLVTETAVAGVVGGRPGDG